MLLQLAKDAFSARDSRFSHQSLEKRHAHQVVQV